jgi:hypothetical protein
MERFRTLQTVARVMKWAAWIGGIAGVLAGVGAAVAGVGSGFHPLVALGLVVVVRSVATGLGVRVAAELLDLALAVEARTRGAQ